MRKAAIPLGILLVLVFAGLYLAPRLLDLDRFKGPIAAQLAQRTGRDVELAGPIGLSLLPSLTLTARDVNLANPPGAAVKDMVRLRALEVKPALLPLLAGRIELRSATLVEPEIDLERLPTGEPNWRWRPAPQAAAAPGGTPGTTAPPVLAFDRLTIQNGAVTGRSAAGIERFEHINASLAFDDVTGQLNSAGSLVARGAAVSFELRSGRLDAAEVPLQLTVTTTPAARLQLDALLTGPGDDRRIAGKLKLTADDARAVLGTLAHLALPSVLAQPVTLSGDLAGSMHQVALDHLAVDLGPAHAEGSLHAAAGTPLDVGLVLSISRLDLDHWPMPRGAALAPLSLFPRAHAATPEAMAAPPPDAAGAAPPPEINASIDLGVEAMLWRGGLIRDARLKLALADGRLNLDRLAALLPGGSQLSLSGNGGLTAEGPRVEGTLEANADDLRSFLGWLGVRLDKVPADRLRKATLSSRVALAADRLELAAIDATVDGTRASGAATVLLRDRPGIGLRLVADRLNLDAYLPQHAAGDAAASTAREAAAPGGSGGAALAGFDANVDARVQALSWRGQPMGEVHLAATLQNGDATIRELSIGDVGGASGTLSGVIEGLAGTPTGQLAFDMRGPELERVLRLVAPSLAAGRSYGGFTLGGGLHYDADTVTLDTDLQVLDGHAHVVGDVARAGGKLDLGVDLDHPSFARLMGSFAGSYQPAGGDPGPLKLSGRVGGGWPRFTIEHLALAIGQGTVDGTLSVDLAGDRPLIAADLAAGDWAIDRLLPARQAALLERGARAAGLRPGVRLAEARTPGRAATAAWSDQPLDLAVMRLADLDLKLVGRSLSYGRWRIEAPLLAATVRDGTLALKQLTGGLFGGDVEATGELDSAATPSLHARLVLTEADLKEALTGAAGIGLVDGRFDVEASLASTGSSEAELIAHLDGDAAIKGHDGSIAGVGLKAMNDRLAARPADLAALLRSGAGGRTAFSTLTGTFHLTGGIASSDDIRLRADGGEGRARASLDLPKWTMASRVEFQLSGAADAPPLVMSLDGAIDQPRIVFDVNALEQFLGQRAPARR